MVASSIGKSAPRSSPFPGGGSRAARLGPAERKDLSVRMLARTEPVTRLAETSGVSRNFLYRQKATAQSALAEAFHPPLEDDRVLFHLPVTKDWLRQFVLGEVLICHSSFRGVIELLRDLFDHNMSLGAVHNIVREAVEKARSINDAQDLSDIRVGAHDEIFQARRPVLVGADVESTFCYLLSEEASRCETAWGVRLLDLEEQGLRPDYTVADGGRGLRAGQAAAWPGVRCHGDVFHPERDLGALAYYLDNRASGCATARGKIERKMERAKRRGRGQSLSKKLALVREAEAGAVALAEDIRILADWMRGDILSVAGGDLAARRELFDWVVDELREREPLCPHRIRPVRRTLEKGRDDFLAFAAVLDEMLADVAARCEVPPHLVHALCEFQGLDKNSAAYWEREARLRGMLGRHFHRVRSAVIDAMGEVRRASSIVENLNSRLRNYFFLRRHIGDGYLDLLRFFLNHRRFMRSERPERVGKSPTELLTREDHPHWLQLLGFELFRVRQSSGGQVDRN